MACLQYLQKRAHPRGSKPVAHRGGQASRAGRERAVVYGTRESLEEGQMPDRRLMMVSMSAVSYPFMTIFWRWGRWEKLSS
jgi:hypothetical protein